MSIEITFHTRNAAFEAQRPEEICRILEIIKEKVMRGAEGGVIHDVNGNRVGEWHDEGPDTE